MVFLEIALCWSSGSDLCHMWQWKAPLLGSALLCINLSVMQYLTVVFRALEAGIGMALGLGSSGMCSAAQHVLLWEDPTQQLGGQRRRSGQSLGRWQLSPRGLCLPPLTAAMLIQLLGPGEGSGTADKLWPL